MKKNMLQNMMDKLENQGHDMDSIFFHMDKFCANIDMGPAEQSEAMDFVLRRYLARGSAFDELTLPKNTAMVQPEKSIRKGPLTNDPHIGKEIDPYSMMEVVD